MAQWCWQPELPRRNWRDRLGSICLFVRPKAILTLDAAGQADCPQHLLVDPLPHIAITPLGSRLRILGMAEFIGFDRHIDPKRLQQLRRFFADLLPQLAERLDWQKAKAGPVCARER